jgi:hypothetical protein
MSLYLYIENFKEKPKRWIKRPGLLFIQVFMTIWLGMFVFFLVKESAPFWAWIILGSCFITLGFLWWVYIRLGAAIKVTDTSIAVWRNVWEEFSFDHVKDIEVKRAWVKQAASLKMRITFKNRQDKQSVVYYFTCPGGFGLADKEGLEQLRSEIEVGMKR